MFRQVLRIALQSEAEEIRRRVWRAFLGVGTALLLLLAFVFAVVSFFLWLETRHEPWLAALIVVAVLLIAAFLLWGVGRIGDRARSRRRAEQQMQLALDAVRAAKSGDASLATLAAALATGFAVGRGLSK